jgi:hypothetical protein
MEISAGSFPPLRVLIVLGDNAIVSFSRSAPAGNPVGQHSLVSRPIKLIWTTNRKENTSQLLDLSTQTPYLPQHCIFWQLAGFLFPREFINKKKRRKECHMFRFLRGFAKLRNATVRFVISGRPSVRRSAWNNLALTWRIFMKFDISVFFENVSWKFKSR